MPSKPRLFAIVGAILGFSLLFAFLGVYNNNHLSFVLRTLFWASCITTGSIVGLVCLPLLTTGALKHHHLSVKIMALSLVQALPIPLVIAAYSNNFSSDLSVQYWLSQYGLAIVIAMIINSCVYLFVSSNGLLNDVKKESTVSSFLARLPHRYHSSELYAVSAEDHYLKVHTSLGQELILMRLSDAVKELSGADGMQTHRSWWVARVGIAESISQSGKRSLLLKSGEIAPVSRSFTKAVREAKFIV